MLATTWIQWPDHGGYNFVSGPLADITLLTAFASFLWLWWRKHNCHVHRCWRISWHPHPVHGHPVCKKHHPEGHRVTPEGIHTPRTESASERGSPP